MFEKLADDLANAMEARGYVPDRTRTRYKQLHMHIGDYVIKNGLSVSLEIK